MLGANRIPHRLHRFRGLKYRIHLRQDQLLDGFCGDASRFAGISRFSAYESETRPSLALALGIQPQLNDSVALRAEIRGYGTFLNDNSTFLCNEERCNMHIKGELLGQAQANLGITARF